MRRALVTVTEIPEGVDVVRLEPNQRVVELPELAIDCGRDEIGPPSEYLHGAALDYVNASNCGVDDMLDLESAAWEFVARMLLSR